MKKLKNEPEKIAANLFGRLIANGWVKVPPGWKLVPVQPAPEQVIAGARCVGGLSDQYRAMVDAAPRVFDGEASV